MNSLLCCPHCSAPLIRNEHVYLCPNGHNFDLSSAGYVHLLPANQKHSKNPGDDKAMVAARFRFLEKGYYAPMRDAIANTIVNYMKQIESPVLLDSGCGEGYYTAAFYQTLLQAGHKPHIVGIDISKFALRRAAKRLPQAEFAVASVYHLPLANNTVHFLTNIFSPLALDEFLRVILPGGYFCYAVPGANHLWEMKELLYTRPYKNPVRQEEYPGFVYKNIIPIQYTIHLNSSDDIMALFSMTPYVWKTPKESVQRLTKLSHLETQIEFYLHLFQKK